MEDEFIEDLASFSQDPLGFVLWAFPWGEPGELEKFNVATLPCASDEAGRHYSTPGKAGAPFRILLPEGTPYSFLHKYLLRPGREAVADAREYFTRPFLRDLESTSPFRLKFLRSRHQKLAGRKGMFSSLFEALVESSEPNRSSDSE